MGQLKPGATYVYEKANGVTYAREIGAPAHTRQPIGWDHHAIESDRLTQWMEILAAADNIPALQTALDHAIVIYQLARDHNATVMHHPV